MSKSTDMALRYNAPVPVERLETALDRVQQKVRVDESGCWIWTDSCTNTGAPQVYWKGASRPVRSLVWISARVEPKPPFIRLTCGDPRCVNPDHMEARQHHPNKDKRRESCPQGHSYAEYGAPQSDGSTRCRICKGDIQRRKRAKRRARGAA